jgi:2-polyprenyl-6-hydroxyphenyl methylase/3-demethylubiquinone-9 3-methyltransferase
MNDLTEVSTHFRFGENWQGYLKHIDADTMREAEAGLLRLIPADRFAGASFIDIGCGSGIHAVVAQKLGAKVTAVDVDPDSVFAARMAAKMFRSDIAIREESVFGLSGEYDIVYSWGVLHHTGDMWRAIRHAAGLVKPGGLFAIALYQKTPSCGRWAKIKRFYSRAPKPVQALVRWPYTAAYLARIAASGQNPIRRVREHKKLRGMNFFTDIHDWLGGYPYESASADEIVAFFRKLGFKTIYDGRIPESRGLLGTGCAQFTFEKAKKRH